jgi:hypothetical protein
MLRLHRMLMPATHPSQAADRCPDVLATWLRHSPSSRAVDRDWEDWSENAHFLHALDLDGPVTMVAESRFEGFMDGDCTPLVAPAPDAEHAIMWGGFRKDDASAFPMRANLHWNHAGKTRTIQRYASSEVFLRHAGRRVRVLDYDMDSIKAELRAMHAAGIREGFYKTRDKGLAERFTMGEDASRLLDDMDPTQDFRYHFMMREGDRDGLIMQEGYEPTREYRIFVVGDRPVTGAGCIEAMTPADCRDQTFDTRMETVRGSGEVEDDPEAVARFVEFAKAYAMEWAAKHGDGMAYGLDLSIDARNGRIVPIEMNPFMGLGLYANDPKVIVPALVAGIGR